MESAIACRSGEREFRNRSRANRKERRGCRYNGESVFAECHIGPWRRERARYLNNYQKPIVPARGTPGEGFDRWAVSIQQRGERG